MDLITSTINQLIISKSKHFQKCHLTMFFHSNLHIVPNTEPSLLLINDYTQMTLVVKFPFSIFLLSRHDKINPPASLSIFLSQKQDTKKTVHTKKAWELSFFPSRVPLIFSSLFSCSMRRGNLTQQPCYSFSHALLSFLSCIVTGHNVE